jgi:copper chaperone CopZ
MRIQKFIQLMVVFCLATPVNAQNDHTANDTTTSFKVYGVCKLCQQRIESNLQLKGISAASWNIDSKMLTVTYDPSKISLDKINNRLAAAGHDTYYKTAADADYYALPECCYYRDPKTMQHADATDSMAANVFVKGVVLAEDKKGAFTPLQGASVKWLETGTGTITNADGVFNIAQNGERLVISYTGYIADTISIIPSEEIKIILGSNNQLKEVKVTASKASTYINSLDVFRTQNITQKELFKGRLAAT